MDERLRVADALDAHESPRAFLEFSVGEFKCLSVAVLAQEVFHRAAAVERDARVDGARRALDDDCFRAARGFFAEARNHFRLPARKHAERARALFPFDAEASAQILDASFVVPALLDERVLNRRGLAGVETLLALDAVILAGVEADDLPQT